MTEQGGLVLRVYAFTRTQGGTLTCARSETTDDLGRLGLSCMLMGPEHRLTMLIWLTAKS